MDRKQLALQELAKRELARRHFKNYVSYMFQALYNQDYVFGEWHNKFFDALERVRKGELKRLMVFLPPRSGKSEIISKMFPSFILGENPRKQIIISSYCADLANDFGRKAKKIVDSLFFKNIFHDFELSKDKKEGGNWETKEGGGYYSVGVQGSLTGRGGNILIVDDPIRDRQDAESPLIRQRIWDWYTSTFYTRKQSEDTAIIVLQTRWNTDDLAGRLIANEKNGGDKWEILSIPALDENDNSFFPERFSSEYYKNERDNIGIRDFSALYQQDPIQSTGQLFKSSSFRYFALSDFEKENGMKKTDFEVGIFVDPAFSSRENSDDAVIMGVARHKITKEIYLLEIQAGTFPPSVATKLPINMALKLKSQGWTVRIISCEDVSLNRDQSIFCNTVENEMKLQGAIFNFNRYKPNGKKEDRIRYTLEPYFDRNALFFRVDESANDAWRKLEEQLMKFPASKHDDIMDCLTQSIQVFDTLGITQEYKPAQRDRTGANWNVATTRRR